MTTLRLFAERLTAARKKRGYEAAAHFAREIGVEDHTYRAWEAARNNPSLDMFALICQRLEVEPNQLLPHLTHSLDK